MDLKLQHRNNGFHFAFIFITCFLKKYIIIIIIIIIMTYCWSYALRVGFGEKELEKMFMRGVLES